MPRSTPVWIWSFTAISASWSTTSWSPPAPTQPHRLADRRGHGQPRRAGRFDVACAPRPGHLQETGAVPTGWEQKTSVEGSFEVAGNEVRFHLGSYDRSRALIVDPVLSYATYLGGTGTDYIGNTTGRETWMSARPRVSRWTARAARM